MKVVHKTHGVGIVSKSIFESAKDGTVEVNFGGRMLEVKRADLSQFICS